MELELSGNRELHRLPRDPGVPCPVGPVPPAGADTLCRPPPDPGVPCAFEPFPLAGNSEFRRLAGATKSLVSGRAALAACGQKYCIGPKGTLRTPITYILSTAGVGYLVSPIQKGHESTSGKAYTMSFQASSQGTLLMLRGCPAMAPRRLPTFPRSCSYVLSAPRGLRPPYGIPQRQFCPPVCTLDCPIGCTSGGTVLQVHGYGRHQGDMSPCALPTSCNKWHPVLLEHATLPGPGLDEIPFSSGRLPWCPLGAIQDAGPYVGG